MNPSIDLVQRFLAAWGDQQLEQVMQLFADDAAFNASVGTEPGRLIQGRAAIRATVEAMFKGGAGTAFHVTGLWGSGEDWFATWTVSSVSDPGGIPAVKGIDHFVVRNGLIGLKDAYRKLLPS